MLLQLLDSLPSVLVTSMRTELSSQYFATHPVIASQLWAPLIPSMALIKAVVCPFNFRNLENGCTCYGMIGI